MSGSGILDVAIGLIFVYLLLGLLCSAFNEWIARMFALRSSTLEAGIKNLLKGQCPDGKELADVFYNHPLVKSLYKKGKKPSYIPNSTFALILMDIFAPGKESGSEVIEGVRNTVAQLPDSCDDVKKSLLLLTSSTEKDIKKVRENIEEWFDNSMARVSGWYKRKTQTITLIVAFVVSVGLNVDTFSIADHLYRDDSVRALAVTTAQEIVQQPLPADSTSSLPTRIKEAQGELDKLQLPVGWSAPVKLPHSFWEFVNKIFGWLFTAFALSLGAPFWFDVLKKLVNLRSTGAAPETVTEKKPEKS